MANLQPRREVWELGAMPLHVICPNLDSATLMLAHSKLLIRSAVEIGGERESWLKSAVLVLPSAAS